MNVSRMRSSFLLVLCLLGLSAVVFAKTSVDTNAIFVPRSDDLSLSFLRMIFGSVGLALKGTNNQLIGEIFRIFNTGILVVVGGLIGYTALMTVISTSQDANQAFQNKVSPWAVFRIVTGSALLVPQFNGFSGIQVIVMTVVVQGIGFANYAWDNALNYIQDSGGAVYVSQQDGKFTDLKALTAKTALAPNMMKSALCLSTMKSLYRSYLKQCGESSSSTRPSDFMVFSDKSKAVHYGLKNHIVDMNAPLGACESFPKMMNWGISGSLSEDEWHSVCGKFTMPSSGSVSGKTQDYYFLALNQAALDSVGVMDAQFRRLQRNLESDIRSGKFGDNNALLDDGKVIVRKECATDTDCMMAHYYVTLASDYYSLSRPARVEPNTQTDNSGWIDDAKAQGWIMAATHYKNLVGGGGYKKQKALKALDTPEWASPIHLTTSAGKKDDLFKELNHIEYANRFKSAFLANAVLLSSLPKVNGDNGILNRDYSSKASKILNDLEISEKPMSGGASSTGLPESYKAKAKELFLAINQSDFTEAQKFSPTVKANKMSSIANVRLDFASSNLQTSVMLVVQEMFGFNLINITDQASYQKGGNPGACGRFKEAIYNQGGGATFDAEAAVASSCIVPGIGVLGGLLAEYNNGTYDPIQAAARLGRTMIHSATLYWSNTFSQLYKNTIEMAWGSFGIQAAIGTANGVLQAFASMLGPAASSIINIPANIGTQAIRVLFELDKAAMEMFLPLGGVMATMLFGTGVVLGIYIPFMPFLLFLFGAIGWIISVIEAMVAAPLVAMGVTHPEGHDLLGKAEQSLMLLLGVFIRPITMIIGLFFAIILANVSMKMLNMGFIYAFSDFYGTMYQVYEDMGASGIKGFMYALSSIGLFMVYTYVVLAVLDQVFSLIWQIPDRILRWIGGPQDQSGTAGMMQGIRRGSQDSASQMGQGASQATSGTGISGPDVQSGSVKKPKQSKGKTSVS